MTAAISSSAHAGRAELRTAVRIQASPQSRAAILPSAAVASRSSGHFPSVNATWNRTTGEQLAEIPTKSFVYSVRFSPDNRLLAIGDNNSNLYLWDVKERSLQTYQGYGRITDVAFTMDGDMLLALGDELHLFDVKTRTTKRKMAAATAAQGNLALSPQGVTITWTVSLVLIPHSFVTVTWGVNVIAREPVFVYAHLTVGFDPTCTVPAALLHSQR